MTDNPTNVRNAWSNELVYVQNYPESDLDSLHYLITKKSSDFYQLNDTIFQEFNSNPYLGLIIINGLMTSTQSAIKPDFLLASWDELRKLPKTIKTHCSLFVEIMSPDVSTYWQDKTAYISSRMTAYFTEELETRQTNTQLQKDLVALEAWASTWGMNFNASKYYVMNIHRKKNPLSKFYQLNGHILQKVSENP